MTAYTFTPNASNQFVNWNDPTVWVGGVVPDSLDADVVFPLVTTVSTGSPYFSFITIGTGQSFSVNSVNLTSNYLLLDGNLSVTGDFATQNGEIDMQGGSLSVGSLENEPGLDIQGNGQVNVAGTLTNAAVIVGDGLTVSAAALDNTGFLAAASGDLTVNVNSGGFANLSGSTLTGGTYDAGIQDSAQGVEVLDLNVGGTIAVDAATIDLRGGGQIASFDPGSAMYVPIQSSLNTIAPSGKLSLSDQTYSWGNLTDNGTLLLSNAVLSPTQLTIGGTGTLGGGGTVTTGIVNNGVIAAGFASLPTFGIPHGLLQIEGAVTGTGSLGIAPGFFAGSLGNLFATLELGGPTSQNVSFGDGTGTLVLDSPVSFTGDISPPSGGKIVLTGIALGAVTGYSYSGNSNGGTLTIDEGGGSIALAFSGDFTTSNFQLSAGPQALSSSPPSLLITVGGPTLSVAGTASYHAGATTTALSPSATLGDISGTKLSGATIAITGGTFANDGDVLAASTAGTLIGAHYDPSSETLTLTGKDTIADYQTVLRTIGFSSTSSNPTNGQAETSRAITWTVTDASNFTASATTNLSITEPNPPPPAGSTANLITRSGATGASQIFDLGSGTILAQYALGQIGSEWQLLGFGGFNAPDTSDFILRQSGTNAIDYFDVANNQVVAAGPLGNIGAEWQMLGFGDFAGNPGESDMLMRNSGGNDIDYFDIQHNQVVAAGAFGDIGAEWQVLGFGDFSGNPGESDMLMRDTANGAIEYFDIQHNQVAAAGPMGNIGAEWQVLGFGDFSGNPGESDMLMRNSGNNDIDYFDIQHNQVVAAGPIGNIGAEWQVLGFGNVGGNVGEVDMVMRDTSGATDYFPIQHNQIAGAASIGTIASDFNVVGLANLPGIGP